MTAVLHAVHTHGALLRASIATPGNDHRLGGHEAPPPIISVYLGQALEKLLFAVGEERAHASKARGGLDLEVPTIPEMALDETDRNRTSPFPFTGNKFEFRAVGSSQNPALPLTVLNGIIADSLNQIVDAIEKQILQKKKPIEAAKEVLKSTIKKVRPICFSGDNYAPEWEKEAKKRNLPVIAKSAHAFSAFLQPDTFKALEGIFTKEELHARVEIMKHRYCKIMQIETKALLDAFHTQILPAAIRFQQELATSIKSVGSGLPRQRALLKKVTGHIERALALAEESEKALSRALAQESGKQHFAFCDVVAPACEHLRKQVDALELLIDDRLWPSPKYSEMLNVI
jgi:glutamine synthetase